MADYYGFLTRRIKETSDDPAKLREVVYEGARLALRLQIEQQRPCLSIDEPKHQISELEDAIARLEAVAAGAHGRPGPEPSEAAAGPGQQRRDELIQSEADHESHLHNPLSAEEAGLAAVAGSLSERENREPESATAAHNASGESRDAPGEFEEDDASDTVERLSNVSRPSRDQDNALYTYEKPRPQPLGPHPAEVADPEAKGRWQGDRGKREPRKAVPDFRTSLQNRYAPIQSEEDDAPDSDEESHPYPRHSPPADLPDKRGPRELIFVPDHAKRSTYLVNPHDFVSPEGTHRIAPAPRSRARVVVFGLMIALQLAIAALAVAAFYVAMWGRDNSVQTAKETPSTTGPPQSTRPAAAPDGTVAAASLAAPPIAAAPPFALPTTYGVYAMRNNRLIELERVEATPVDPRIRTQLQIVKPGRVVIDAETPAFVVFRRDLVSSAPDKVPVRIAARVAHSMIFDAGGKPSVTTPAIHTWLIRDQGYNLRVSPLRESAEMVMLRPEDPELSFSSGRYELMFGGQAYDFLVAGEVTDPAHCVEGVATPRGPVFYECGAAR